MCVKVRERRKEREIKKERGKESESVYYVIAASNYPKYAAGLP